MKMHSEGIHRSFKDRVVRTLYFNFLRKSQWYRKLIDTDRTKAIDLCWRATFCRPFPWKNPKTLNEKISWLSAKTDTSLWTKLSDKYQVREYVGKRCKDSGLRLPVCYGVWNTFEEIDFHALPDKFVLKCTHDCGSTVLVRDKATMDYKSVQGFINKHLASPMGYDTCEPHYTLIKPRVMAEEFLEEDSSSNSQSLIDYKFWCLDGKVDYVFVVYDRHLNSETQCNCQKSTANTLAKELDVNNLNYNSVYSDNSNVGRQDLKEQESTEVGAVFDLYDVSTWTPVRHYLSDDYQSSSFKDIPRPENLEQMIEAAKCLAEGFPQVRVDLYNIGGMTYFGELTFTSNGGRMEYFTDELQSILGAKIDISELVKRVNAGIMSRGKQ